MRDKSYLFIGFISFMILAVIGQVLKYFNKIDLGAGLMVFGAFILIICVMTYVIENDKKSKQPKQVKKKRERKKDKKDLTSLFVKIVIFAFFFAMLVILISIFLDLQTSLIIKDIPDEKFTVKVGYLLTIFTLILLYTIYLLIKLTGEFGNKIIEEISKLRKRKKWL